MRGMAVGLVHLGLSFLVASCAGGTVTSAEPHQANRPLATSKPTAREVSTRPKQVDEKEARVRELRAEARDFASRGALDVAAQRLRTVWEETGDAETLWQAALWAEEAWHYRWAGQLLKDLAKDLSWKTRAEARRQSLPERYLTEESPQEPDVDPLLVQATGQLASGDEAAALITLERAAQVAPSSHAARLIATPRWKRGEKYSAQLWWARTRASSGNELATADLRTLSQLHYANSSFALRPTYVYGFALPELTRVMALQFATASGELFAYATDWGVTAYLSGNIKEVRSLHRPDYRSKKPYLDDSSSPLSTLALPGSAGIDGAEEIAAVALSDDEQTLALLSTQNELWTFKVEKDTAQLLHRGLLSDPARLKASGPRDTVMVHARKGQTERLFLADPNAPEWEIAGDVLELDLQGRVLGRLRAHRAQVTSLAVTRSGKFLASAARKQVKVWDLSNREVVYESEAKRNVESVHFHPTDEVLEVATEFSAERLDWRRKELLASEPLGETVQLTHARDGRYSARSQYKHEAIGVRREGETAWHWVEGARDTEAALFDDGKQLLVGKSGLWLFQLSPWRATALTSGYSSTPVFSPSGGRIAACLEDGIAFFDRNGGRLGTAVTDRCPEQLEFASEDELVVARGETLEWLEVPSGRSVRSAPGRRFFRLNRADLRLRDGTVEHRVNGELAREWKADSVGISHSRERFVIASEHGRSFQAFDHTGAQTSQVTGQSVPRRLAISK